MTGEPEHSRRCSHGPEHGNSSAPGKADRQGRGHPFRVGPGCGRRVPGMLFPASFPAVFVSFVLKGLGSTQAMYLSLAIPADVLDHQEALYGARTDGFTMTFYGGVLSGMTGIATGLMNGLLYFLGYSASSLSSPAIRMVMPWLFIGGETICYACIFFLVMRLKAERYSVLDHMVIRQDQVLIENSMRFGQKRGGHR